MKNYELVIQSAENDEATIRAELIGCLDSHTVVSFEKETEEALADEAIANTILNLEGLTYISSAGISALMSLTYKLRQREGELYLLRPTEKVLRVFRTLGFTNIFKIVEDESEIAVSPER